MEMTLREALAMQIPDDEEGYVLDILDSNGEVIDHLKLKGEQYKLLHSILTNTSGRRVWVELAGRAIQHMVKKDKDWALYLGHDPADFIKIDFDKSFEDSVSDAPDEFHDWLKKKTREIKDDVNTRIQFMIDVADELKEYEGKERWEMGRDYSEFLTVNRYLLSGDLSGIVQRAWKDAKPTGLDLPFKTDDE